MGWTAPRRLATLRSAPLRAHVGGSGLAARYGGEEFAVVLPGASATTAGPQCEYLRAAVYGLPDSLPVTASIGVALLDGPATTPARCARAPTARFTAAKRRGPNRVGIGST